jgi:hypothetical protein
VKSPIGEMVLHDDGVIIHTLEEGALVDAQVAVQVLEATSALAAGRPVAVVVDLRAVAFADRRSRDLFARDPSGGVEIATALVAGKRIADFLAAQFVNKAKPDRPTEVFSDVDDAATWAADQLQAHASDA